MRILLVWLLVCGCAQHRVAIEAGTLRGRAQELRTTGAAAVWVVDRDDDHSKRVRETLHADQHVRIDGSSRTFRELVGPCDRMRPIADQPGCLLADLDNTASLELRTYRRPRFGPIVAGVIVGSFATAATCHFACAEGTDARRASDVTLIATSLVSAGAILYVIASCLTGGCRD